jgi:archaellum component FlaC
MDAGDDAPEETDSGFVFSSDGESDADPEPTTRRADLDGTLDNVTEAVDETVENVAETVNETVGEAAERVDDAVENATETVDETVGEAAETVDETVEDVTEAVEAVPERVGEIAGEIPQQVEATAGQVPAEVEAMVEEFSERVGTAADRVPERLEGVSEVVPERSGKIAEEVPERIGSVVEAVPARLERVLSESPGSTPAVVEDVEATLEEALGEIDEVVEGVPDHAPFVDRLDYEFRPLDVAALAVVPAVLFGVFRLPAGLRRAYAFTYTDPSVLSAFTANYVHITVPHLASNLVGYVLLAGVGYLVALANGNRRRFVAALVVVLTVLPAPLSYLNLAFPRAGTGLGFSGLNMAIFGYLAVEFSEYLGEYFTEEFGVEDAPLFFFAVMAFVAAPHADQTAGLAIAVAAVAIAAVYLVGLLRTVRPSLSGLGASLQLQGYFELSAVAAVALVVYVPAAFPQDPFTSSGIVNVYIHLLGFCIGFIGSYVAVISGALFEPGAVDAGGW